MLLMSPAFPNGRAHQEGDRERDGKKENKGILRETACPFLAAFGPFQVFMALCRHCLLFVVAVIVVVWQ